jgi:hypothetical protein
MAEFRFFGTETVINGTGLTQYGQVVDMDQDKADALIAGSPPALLLPEELWAKIFEPGGDTDAALAEFPSATIHSVAPEAFRAKAKAVRVAFHEYRAELLDPGSTAAAPELAKPTERPPVKPTETPAPKEKPVPLNGSVEVEPETESR